MTSSVGYMFNWQGQYLCELQDIPFTRSWVTNSPSNQNGGIGQCTFTISKKDNNFSLKNLTYGNLLYIHHPTLPDWVGQVVEQPGLHWKYGEVDVTVMAAEQILMQRGMNPADNVKGTVGGCFADLLDKANSLAVTDNNGGAIGCTQIMPGQIFLGGAQVSEPLSKDVLMHMRNILKTNQTKSNVIYDFDITPSIDQNGRLILNLNLYEHRGIDTLQTISDADFASDYTFDEQGPIENVINGYSRRKAPANPDTAVAGHSFDATSAAMYGPRSYTISNASQTDVSANQAAADSELMQHAYPYKPFMIPIHESSNLWQTLRIGNRWNLDIVNAFGFRADGSLGVDGIARLSVMTFDPMKKIVKCAFEPYTP